MWYSVYMMNDMMPTIEEAISMDDIAQHEHEQWLRECEREERWAAIEAQHGPLHSHAYAGYECMTWKD